MGVSSVALNERNGDNDFDIEPEDEDESQLSGSKENKSDMKFDSKLIEEFEYEDRDDSSLLISPEKPLLIEEHELNSNNQKKQNFHPNPEAQ